MTDVWTGLWVIPLVGFLGYTSHRASLCTVRAVSCALRERRFELLVAFGRTVLWAMVLIIPAMAFRPESLGEARGIGPLWSGLVGGFVFGLGAALNRGCSFSTLQRLADRDWRMLITLGGIFIGSSFCHGLVHRFPVSGQTVGAAALATWMWPVTAGLAVWIVWEGFRLWKRRESWRHVMRDKPVDPAAAALILGLGAGLLYLGFGPWTYLNTLQRTAGSLVSGATLPSLLELVLVPAIVGGMAISAHQRGTWRVRKPWAGWPVNLSGGIFMGLGGAIIPGGNDPLLLRLIPSLAPHSLGTYAALLLGVVVGLMGRRRMGTQ